MQGSSDRVYQASIAPQDGLFLVNYVFGRRCSALSTGTKTPAPVDDATAIKITNKLMNKKKGKGYTEGEDGTPYQNGDDKDSQLSTRINLWR
jgi:bifunctional non-homologous end joining protein LigD